MAKADRLGPKAKNQRQLANLEAALTEAEFGDLAWQDCPPDPGWYWFRVIPSTAIRGPAFCFRLTEPYPMITEGRTLAPGLYTNAGEGQWKRCDTFLRQWAGPLGRPVDPGPPVPPKARRRAKGTPLPKG